MHGACCLLACCLLRALLASVLLLGVASLACCSRAFLLAPQSAYCILFILLLSSCDELFASSCQRSHVHVPRSVNDLPGSQNDATIRSNLGARP